MSEAPVIRFPDAPPRIRALPVNERGFPVPFFAEEIDGKPELRFASPVKLARAVRHNLCWICGQPLGRYKAFCIGPMCAINRASSEPPSHRDCAEFAAIACPFLSRPMAKRVEREGAVAPAGIMLDRNPGVVGVWITESFTAFRAGSAGGSRDGVLFRLGDPSAVLWFAEGRRARLEEVEASIAGGLPRLEEIAEREGGAAPAELAALAAAFRLELARRFARES